MSQFELSVAPSRIREVECFLCSWFNENSLPGQLFNRTTPVDCFSRKYCQRRCSMKKVFLKFVENSNTHAAVNSKTCKKVFILETSSRDDTRPGMKLFLSMVKCLVLFTRFCRDEISFRDEIIPVYGQISFTVYTFLPRWNFIPGWTHPCQKDRDEISSRDEKKKKKTCKHFILGWNFKMSMIFLKNFLTCVFKHAFQN